jgi:hypothetical protein
VVMPAVNEHEDTAKARQGWVEAHRCGDDEDVSLLWDVLVQVWRFHFAIFEGRTRKKRERERKRGITPFIPYQINN